MSLRPDCHLDKIRARLSANTPNSVTPEYNDLAMQKVNTICMCASPVAFCVARVCVCVFPCHVTLLTATLSRPAAEQKVPGGEGSLVGRLRFA